MEDTNTNKQSLFFSIWLQTRETVRQAIDRGFYISAFVFAAFAGTQQVIGVMMQNSAGDEVALPILIGLAIMFGAIGGLFGLCLGSWALSFTGRWLGGKGYFDQLLIACGYASIPGVWILLIQVLLIAIFGQDLFTTTGLMSGYSLGHMLIIMLSGIVMFVISIWGIVINCKAIGEAHGFSAWRGLGNVLLAILVVVVPIALFTFIVGLLNS